LEIFAEIADVFIFTSPLTLNELEQEKNMPAGGILRQALRLCKFFFSNLRFRRVWDFVCQIT